ASTSAYSASTSSASRSRAPGSTRCTAPRSASRNSGWSSATRMVEAIEPSVGNAPLFHERIDHRGIGQGAGVAELVGRVLGDLAQDAAHDLSRARLRQARRPLDVVRRGGGTDLAPHLLHQFPAQFLALLLAGGEGHVGIDAL